MTIRKTICIAALCGLTVVANPARADHGSGASAFSQVPSATPTEHGATNVTFRYELTELESLSDGQLQSLVDQSKDGHIDVFDRSQRYYLDIERGLTHDLSFGISFSFQDVNDYREVEQALGGFETFKGDPSGFNDISIRGKYRFHHDDRNDWALLGGIKLPTGDDRNRLSNGDFLELGGQPSSGSLDVLIGLAHTREFSARARLDFGLTYTARGEGPRDNRLGNRLDFGANLTYRLLAQNSNWVPTAALGLSGRLNNSVREEGVNEENSGGTTYFVTPGIAVSRDRWQFGVSAPIPFSQDLNGAQQEIDWQLIGGISYRFGSTEHSHEHSH